MEPGTVATDDKMARLDRIILKKKFKSLENGPNLPESSRQARR